MRLVDDQGPRCPKCKKIAIKLVSLTDDGKGELMCIRCKRKVRKGIDVRSVSPKSKLKFKLLSIEREVMDKMVERKQLKISEFSLDRLRAYAKNYELRAPENCNEEVEKQFYITELIKLNTGKDEIRTAMDAGRYKGVNSCVCSKCGETKSVRAEVYAKRVEKFGTEEKLKADYECMDCRRSERR